MRPMPAPGSAARNVIANTERLRQERHLSLRALGERLDEAGVHMVPSVLHRLMQGKRRVDADTLTALAEVLGVTPAELLAPPDSPAPPDHPALRETAILAERITRLLEDPGDRFLAGQVDRALRRLQIHVEELTDVRQDAAR